MYTQQRIDVDNPGLFGSGTAQNSHEIQRRWPWLARRTVPWSVQALRSLAKPVFASRPAGRESWAGSSQLKLIVGADDHSDAELPKRLEGAPEQPRKATP